MIVDFVNIAVGAKLDSQFPDVRFLKYQGRVGGVVIDSPSGHVATFNDCFGCEFFSSGATIAFAALQQSVTVHIGLLPITGVVVQRDVRLTAYDAGGGFQATSIASLTAGSGFAAALTVSIATPQIASVTLEPVNDPELLAVITIADIAFEHDTAGGPDFDLRAPVAATLIQGGSPVDVPIAVDRIGGSTGYISLSVGALPPGVTASLLPGFVSGNAATLRLQAVTGPQPAVMTVIVFGVPLSPTAGPASRTVAIDVDTVPLLRVFGPADIDIGTCVPSSAAHGTVARDYWILRDPSFSGTLNVSLEGLPADIGGTVNPETLQFPGGATGERVTVSLTAVAGPVVPDTSVILRLTGAGTDLSFPILLHGTCPQQNRNFLIRGQFSYINDNDVQPLAGAQVEIYRHRSDWYDDRVDVTSTDDQGNFSRELFASIEGDYYARLRLFSAEAQVEDACNSSVWSIDTPHQSNAGGLIDVGSIQISRDGGSGTPRAAVWQGFRNAVLEFQQVTEGVSSALTASGFVNVVVFRGHLTPLTHYEEVHWAHGYTSGDAFFPEPTAPICYQSTSHEFGHVVRDRLDGGFSHWSNDDSLYLYGRFHDSCSILAGTQANAGFAFHEGWAEYWGQQITCCPNDLENEAMEGTVAHDLNTLSTCPGVGRKGMVEVLGRGENIIHSDTEFRREYAQQFPNCPLPSIDEGCIGQVASPLQEQEWFPVLDLEKQRMALTAAINGYERAIKEVQERQLSHSGMRRFVLRAAAEEGMLIVQRMRGQLTELDRRDPPEVILQRAFVSRRERFEFARQRRAIQVRALKDALTVVSPRQRPDVERRIRLLQESRIEDFSLDSLLPLPHAVGDDVIVTRPTPPYRGDRAGEDDDGRGHQMD